MAFYTLFKSLPITAMDEKGETCKINRKSTFTSVETIVIPFNWTPRRTEWVHVQIIKNDQCYCQIHSIQGL